MSPVKQHLAASREDRSSPMKKTILLVEDSKVQKLAGQRILHRAGYLVLLASDGEEGVRLARESRPDLILLDLRLPGIEGEEVLYILKRDPITQQIPVIVVSDLAATNSAELMAAGAADYFEKSRFLADLEGEAIFLTMIERATREAEARSEGKKPPPLVRGQGA
jgi:two-component system cell cycle response regulator DivK